MVGLRQKQRARNLAFCLINNMWFAMQLCAMPETSIPGAASLKSLKFHGRFSCDAL